MYKTIYGPVPSRRLGASLGVDMVPLKTCSFNCVYCECGRNRKYDLELREWVPLETILSEIRDFMTKQPAPDFITLSGSGEPTLHSRMGELIKTVKAEFPHVKVAVLTNSSMLHLPEVRQALFAADVVCPSLDAATEKAYILIDRPHPSLKLPMIIDGIAEFNREWKAVKPNSQLWLEVFIVEGVNTDDENIEALRQAIARINPDRVQLNTLDRPGAEDWVKPAPMPLLEEIQARLGIPHVEIVKKYRSREEIRSYQRNVEESILEVVSRRPETIDGLAQSLGLHVHEVSKYMDILEKEKRVRAVLGSEMAGRGVFYKLREPDAR